MTLRLGTDRPLLVPFLTGGVTADWTDYLLAYQEAGADAIEVGLPFSDPMLDGTTIQQASDQALTRGATVEAILHELAAIRGRLRVPIIVMAYANLVLKVGIERLAQAGVSGLIVSDLPLEESAELESAAAAAGIDMILLVAPVTPDDRLRQICLRSQGFVYAVSVMGVTGERTTLAPEAEALARRAKLLLTEPGVDGSHAGSRDDENPVQRLPVLIGFGVSTPEQAAVAGRAGDGVVVGAALMRRVLDGASPADLRREVGALRAALDQGVSTATPYAEISGDRG
ncbi:tryptophan synthase subunit alpha [Winogradskya consettensis]|uniref:Tryptophan synthase alpha chain n=1 Tax=Winogradskya consettensis TaxID=113560 RepID=A0A919SNY7_9ACTN|nr:tryptophan synthase subunit alpha [Actinoplanes consettensis]GIM74867.1 tryptophan synthase alpha chain [Actinoplanes consettensis]